MKYLRVEDSTNIICKSTREIEKKKFISRIMRMQFRELDGVQIPMLGNDCVESSTVVLSCRTAKKMSINAIQHGENDTAIVVLQVPGGVLHQIAFCVPSSS